MASVFVCRISPKSSAAATAVADFARFQRECTMFGAGIWDNTSKNAMKVGDVIGFILGDDCESTFFYRMEAVLPLEFRQENSWNTEAYSTSANGAVNHREVIRLKPIEGARVVDWKVILAQLGYNPNFVPRGATVLKNVKSFCEFMHFLTQ